jgi:hypothetical protein
MEKKTVIITTEIGFDMPWYFPQREREDWERETIGMILDYLGTKHSSLNPSYEEWAHPVNLYPEILAALKDGGVRIRLLTMRAFSPGSKEWNVNEWSWRRLKQPWFSVKCEIWISWSYFTEGRLLNISAERGGLGK